MAKLEIVETLKLEIVVRLVMKGNATQSQSLCLIIEVEIRKKS